MAVEWCFRQVARSVNEGVHNALNQGQPLVHTSGELVFSAKSSAIGLQTATRSLNWFMGRSISRYDKYAAPSAKTRFCGNR